MNALKVVHWVAALLLSPLLVGIINRTKAAFAGRAGAPFLQPYFDLARLFRKGAVYSNTTTIVFRMGPVVGLAGCIVALAMVPFGNTPALAAFRGDFMLLVYILGLVRFVTMLAALDTGSAFEGMGSSREAFFSIFAELALVLALAALARIGETLTLSKMLGSITPLDWSQSGAALGLIVMALIVVFLAENARIPVDDPATHLELTMIHEVMVLDHSGPDLGMIQYGAALKLWILGAIIVSVIAPVHSGNWLRDEVLFLASMGALAVVVGTVESMTARLRLTYVPRLLVGAGAFSMLALFLVMKG